MNITINSFQNGPVKYTDTINTIIFQNKNHTAALVGLQWLFLYIQFIAQPFAKNLHFHINCMVGSDVDASSWERELFYL